ncbi:MAG: hypothetical protein JW795_11545 [Chitinivibrionales bacterium]|nr:hypothetical protein [Chitinivibrionales bacterium]
MKKSLPISCLLYIFVTGILFQSTALPQTEAFSLHAPDVTTIQLNRIFSSREDIRQFDIPWPGSEPVWAVAVNAKGMLLNGAGMVRIVITDSGNHDYLVYETWSLLQETDSIRLISACMETRALACRIEPVSLKIQIVDATITISSIVFATRPCVPPTEDIAAFRGTLFDRQRQQIIDYLNERLAAQRLQWTAGRTDISEKTYEEKKCIFGLKDSFLPNLQGVEYYTGGVFTLQSGKKNESTSTLSKRTSALIDTFDWRTKHGATNPRSPYYDGDTLGSGWATPIRSQSVPQYCGSCWSHSTVATAEIMTNLYYNRHFDPDLSEHYLMTCSCVEACFTEAKPCSGGRSTKAAQWVVNHGVTDEANFPYQAVDSLTCKDSGAAPTEHLSFSRGIFTDSVPSEDSLKRFLIHYGPLNVFINSMWHCMCLVGYARDTMTNQTTWILKNSFGVASGNNGYMHAQLTMSDCKTVDAFIPPVISKVHTDNDILCADRDGDGFYNWGIGSKPATCPAASSSQEDCDDSRSDLGPMVSDGSCKNIVSSINQTRGIAGPFSWTIRTNAEGQSVITFVSSKSVETAVTLYNCTGATIATLPVNKKNSLVSECIWNTSRANRQMSRGVYICRITQHTANGQRNFSFKLLRP